MRYLRYKLDLAGNEYSVLACSVKHWSGDDPWSRLGVEPEDRVLRIKNASAMPWDEWKPTVLMRQYENAGLCDALFRKESAEVEQHLLEILRETYPGYALGGFDVGSCYLELHFFKEGSEFYFTVVLEHTFDLDLIGPGTVDNIRPSYRVCYPKGGPMQIIERRGSSARILELVPRDPEADDWGGDIYAEVEEFADI